MADKLSCPVCGYQYESGPEAACGPCPLHSDCAMACCPACGHSTINPQKSRWVKRFQKWFSPQTAGPAAPSGEPLKVHVRKEDIDLLAASDGGSLRPMDAASLDGIQPGKSVHISGFSSALSLQHKLRLQAFGVEPGHAVEVIQQHPVTIVRVDHTELAVERLLAERIFVSE